MVSAKLSRGPEWLGLIYPKLMSVTAIYVPPFLPRDDVCSLFPSPVSFPKALGPSYEMLFPVLLVAMTGSVLAQNSAELFAPKYPVVAYAAGSVCLLVPTLCRVWLISK
jgi:hypothetical protein